MNIEKYLKLLFTIFIFVLFLFEGLGINNGRQVAYNLILLLPFFLFIPSLISKNNRKIVLPQKLTLMFFVFFVLSLVSAIFSVNLQNSFESLFLYISLFVVFICVFNYKEILSKAVIYLVFILSFIFSIFSLFVGFFIQQNSLFSIPIDVANQGYQFVYSAFGSHNHLGDFLLLPLTILIFLFLTRKFKLNNFLVFLFFIPYFIFAYSRSAYIDLILITLFMFFYVTREYKKNINQLALGFLTLTVVVLAVFLFIVPTDTIKPTLLNSVNSTLQQKFNLRGGKLFLAFRNKYATQGLFSLSKSPWLGIGPGNFEYASIKYTDTPNNYTVTSHNLFFDIFTENGVFAGIVFLLIMIEIARSIKNQLFRGKIHILNKNNVLLISLFLVMLLNFQTDYTYLIHSFLLLFFIFLGLFYEEKRLLKFDKFLLPLSLILFIIFNLTILSNIAILKNNYKLAFYLYPLNKDIYQTIINGELKSGNNKEAFKHLNYYVKLFNGDSDVLLYAGNTYYSFFGEKKSLTYYERTFEANNFLDVPLVKRIYQIKLNVEGKQKAKEFANRFFLKLSGVPNRDAVSYSYRLSVFKFCKEIYVNCPYYL